MKPFCRKNILNFFRLYKRFSEIIEWGILEFHKYKEKILEKM